MRRFLLVAVASAAIALTAPGVSGAQTVTGDSVVGSGTARFITPELAGLTVPFQIDVRSGTSGEQPTGSVQLLLTFSDPSCLVLRPDEGEELPSAAMNVLNPLTGARVVIQVGGGALGQFIGASVASSPSDCEFRSPPASVAEVVSGHIEIVDAPPLPTSTEQCKNGGWRTYAIFKNQGGCVNFVATGAKNPPAGGT
jgi:hypothetical protein